MDDRSTADGVSPDAEDAFSLLSDETRLAILRELYAREEPLSFSELRERVGMRDSGQFNYHLGKLTGQFVEQGEDGYELTMAGLRVLGAVFAGSYEEVTIEPVPIDDLCPLCEGELAAGYDRDHFEIACADCEAQIVTYPAPPGILRGRDRDALPQVFSRYARNILEQITDDFCPFCLGQIAVDIDADHAEESAVTFRCRHCGVEMNMTVGVSLLVDPDVDTFAQDHGLDIQNTPIWGLEPIFDSDVRLIEDDTDPAAIEVEITMDAETFTARLDDDLTVLETTRS